MTEGFRPRAPSASHSLSTSLLNMRNNFPFGHDRACSTVNFFPHPLQAEGRFSSIRPYCKRRLYRNLYRDNSVSLSRWGTAVKHAPLLVSISKRPHSWPPNSYFRSASAADSSLSLAFLSLVMAFLAQDQCPT